MDNQIVFSPIGLGEMQRMIQDSVKSAIDGLVTKQPEKNDVCSLTEAVEITGLQKSAIYKLTMPQFRAADKNPIPYYKNGKFLRFKRSELEAWITRRLIRADHDGASALTLAKSAGRKR